MKCSRLTHFVKIETGTLPIVRCCHMASPPRFKSLDDLENSNWLKDINEKIDNDIWPADCVRCQQAEEAGLESVRIISNKHHNLLKEIRDNYLIVDVIVDTICNAACSICSADLSSTIAKMTNIPVNRFDGLSVLDTISNDRILQLDILGGEPGASKKSQKLLNNLANFPNLQKIHISTNGSMKIKEIERLLEKGITVDLVISMDGTNKIFEYCRYPINWLKFEDNILFYKALQKKYQNLSLLLWTSISSLCVADIPNMVEFSKKVDIPLNGAPIQFPEEISLGKTNKLTLNAKKILNNDKSDFSKKIESLLALDENNNDDELNRFLMNNDQIRKITHTDYMLV